VTDNYLSAMYYPMQKGERNTKKKRYLPFVCTRFIATAFFVEGNITNNKEIKKKYTSFLYGSSLHILNNTSLRGEPQKKRKGGGQGFFTNKFVSPIV